MMTLRTERALARERLQFLAEKQAAKKVQLSPLKRNFSSSATPQELSKSKSGLHLHLVQGGLSISPPLFLFGVAACGAALVILGTRVCSPFFAPLFIALGVWLPFAWLDRRIEQRALEFSIDYPAVLMAAASSIQVGMTPYAALERSTKLLPPKSPARQEVEILLKKLREGVPKEQAMQSFATSYRLPDLDLFRSAFLLAAETGGRFSPTLQRLASVSSNRMNLMKMASVTTASMRMTGNVLITLAPVILIFLSTRIKDFWDTFANNPTANFLASLGIFIIAGGYLCLRKMSQFKP